MIQVLQVTTLMDRNSKGNILRRHHQFPVEVEVSLPAATPPPRCLALDTDAPERELKEMAEIGTRLLEIDVSLYAVPLFNDKANAIMVFGMGRDMEDRTDAMNLRTATQGHNRNRQLLVEQRNNPSVSPLKKW